MPLPQPGHQFKQTAARAAFAAGVAGAALLWHVQAAARAPNIGFQQVAALHGDRADLADVALALVALDLDGKLRVDPGPNFIAVG